MFHLTALLKYINLFVLDVINIFQCTGSGKYVGAALPSEPHPYSYITIWLQFFDKKLIYYTVWKKTLAVKKFGE